MTARPWQYRARPEPIRGTRGAARVTTGTRVTVGVRVAVGRWGGVYEGALAGCRARAGGFPSPSQVTRYALTGSSASHCTGEVSP